MVGLPNIHIECKRVEKLNLYDAMEQSTRDAKGDGLPVVVHKRNHHEWLVIMRAEDWFNLYSKSDLSVHVNIDNE